MPLNTPKSAFYVPTDSEVAQNPDYWDGWAKGIPFAMTLTYPANLGFADYWQWRGYLQQFLYPPNPWQSFNMGMNAAILQAGIWLWINDPNSPHNKVS